MNADVLRELEERGFDLSRETVVDFSHIFSDAASAESFIKACATHGFEAEETTDDEMDSFDVTVSKQMIPVCESITAIEELLAKLAEQHNGRSDGWGFISS